eukprot:TRINITY_DN4244_c0_g1_i19.p1 TRINITY_DN4244_c0_g1~~TRINITY_DN4244_c0_g1_i19.p1  ORF type:complete len:223 (-),score=49.93 TRINITY_DN4244_c0_g1_i19:142-810(-)
MVLHGDALFVFGGTGPNGLETNEFWKFDLNTKEWEEIHGFQRPGDPLERNSPATALKTRGYMTMRNKNLDGTLKQTGHSALKPVPANASTTKAKSMSKSSSMRELPSSNKKKQFDLSKAFYLNEANMSAKEPLSPVSIMMSNSIVLKSQAKKPLKDVYQGPVEKEEGEIAARLPCARDGHAAGVHNDRMVIFGGDRGGISFNDLHFYLLNCIPNSSLPPLPA